MIRLSRGRQQRVEQQLAIFAAHVAVANPWGEARQVVAVAFDVAREAPVVQPQQTDDAVRDRPHGHQRADGEVPGAEIRSGRLPPEPVRHDRAHVVAREIDRAHRLVDGGLAHELVEERGQLCPLPCIARETWR